MGSDGLCVSVNLKDGDGSVLIDIRKPVQSIDGQGLSSLLQSLRDVQNETNDTLTQLMASSVGTTKNGKNGPAKQVEASEEESDDADEASTLKRSNSSSAVPSKRPCISSE